MHYRKTSVLALAALLLSIVAMAPRTEVRAVRAAQVARAEYQVRVSAQADRGRSVAVDTLGVISGTFHAFIMPTEGIRQVRFFIDPSEANLRNPTIGGSPFHVADKPPFDLNGTEGRRAKGFESGWLLNGRHTIVAAIDLLDGRTEVKIARVLVYNGPRALLFAPEPTRFTIAPDGQATGALSLLSSDFKGGSYTLDSDAEWLSFEGGRARADANRGTAPSYHTIRVNAKGMATGTYTATITATGDGLRPAGGLVTMEVRSPDSCSPLPCSQLLIRPPYTLNFRGNHRQIADKAGVGTGFTYVEPQSWDGGRIAANLQMDTAGRGTLNLATMKGNLLGAARSVDTVLGVGVDASKDILLLDAIVLDLTSQGRSGRAGLWYGLDHDNVLKIQLVSRADDTRVVYQWESDGLLAARVASAPLPSGFSVIGLQLRLDPRSRAITGSYAVDRGGLIRLGHFILPDRFFGPSAAASSGRSESTLAGIFAEQEDSGAPLVYKFDTFAVTAETASAATTRAVPPTASARNSTSTQTTQPATSLPPPAATPVPPPVTSMPSPTATYRSLPTLPPATNTSVPPFPTITNTPAPPLPTPTTTPPPSPTATTQPDPTPEPTKEPKPTKEPRPTREPKPTQPG